MKSFLVKESPAFKLRVEVKDCLRPNNLKHLQFIQECYNKDGELDFTSKYQFFLTDEEIKNLTKELSNG